RRAPAPGALFRVRGTLCASVARPESDRVAQAVATTQESWRLSSGKEIDRSLVVINDLGGGSRYEVFRAWDRQLFCQVAVKVMRRNRVHEARVRDGFEAATGIAPHLEHQHLLRLARRRAAAPRPYRR